MGKLGVAVVLSAGMALAGGMLRAEDETPVAAVGGALFTDLQQAVNAATNETDTVIRLLRDVQISGVYFPRDCRAVLDLAGCSLDTTGPLLLQVLQGGSVTVTNSVPEVASRLGVLSQDVRLSFGVSVLSNGVFTLAGGTLTNCVAGMGGAVYLDPHAHFVMTGGRIAACRAERQFVTDEGWFSGGAVYASEQASIELLGGEIVGCRADEKGGALYLGPKAVLSGLGSVTITNCSAQQGGGLYMDAEGEASVALRVVDCQAECGGGVFVETASLSGTLSVEACTARQRGGGLFAEGSNVSLTGGRIAGCSSLMGGGLYLSDCTAAWTNGVLEACSVEMDESVGGDVLSYGGGVYCEGDDSQMGTLDLVRTAVRDCRAECAATEAQIPSSGGGLFSETVVLTLSDCTFEHCVADYGGGVLCSAGECHVRGSLAATNNVCTLFGADMLCPMDDVLTVQGTLTVGEWVVDLGGGLCPLCVQGSLAGSSVGLNLLDVVYVYDEKFQGYVVESMKTGGTGVATKNFLACNPDFPVTNCFYLTEQGAPGNRLVQNADGEAEVRALVEAVLTVTVQTKHVACELTADGEPAVSGQVLQEGQAWSLVVTPEEGYGYRQLPEGWDADWQYGRIVRLFCGGVVSEKDRDGINVLVPDPVLLPRPFSVILY